MNLLSISAATAWVDFFTIVLSKVFHLGKSLDKWYAQFGIVAVLSDCLVIILGILIAQVLYVGSCPYRLAAVAIGVQIVHDVLFYLFVIKPIPVGHNAMIDLFKEYATENSYKIIIADSLMIGSAVLLASVIEETKNDTQVFLGLLAVYALTYVIYTR